MLFDCTFERIRSHVICFDSFHFVFFNCFRLLEHFLFFSASNDQTRKFSQQIRLTCSYSILCVSFVYKKNSSSEFNRFYLNIVGNEVNERKWANGETEKVKHSKHLFLFSPLSWSDELSMSLFRFFMTSIWFLYFF